jgi:hypothetical protein
MAKKLIELVMDGKELKRRDNKKDVVAMPIDYPLAFTIPRGALRIHENSYRKIAPKGADAFVRCPREINNPARPEYFVAGYPYKVSVEVIQFYQIQRKSDQNE